jgi:hypothetical protein
MPYARITVPLTTADRTVLLDIAEMECRDPREHLRYLLRRDAQERGLLNSGLKTKAAHRGQNPTENDQTKDPQQVLV